MIKGLVNLPFRVLGKAARAVQKRSDDAMKAQHGAGAEGDEWEESGNIPEWDTPEDFHPTDLAVDTKIVLAELKRYEAAIIDVRAPSEFAHNSIVGADNLPTDTLAIRLAELPPAGNRIVVFCADGVRSAEAARFLRFRGIEDAFYLEGGLTTWQAAGGTTAPRGEQ